MIVGFILALAAFLMSTILLAKGIENSLRVGTERLGADIVVVPAGKEAEVQAALLLGKPVSGAWMPAENADKIARLEGVDKVSPQLYLETLTGAACCSAWEMFMIAFDPQTDFTVTPWLKEKAKEPLGIWDVIGGAWVFVPEGYGEIKVYGSKVNLVGELEPTGMGLDQTMFLSFDTAKALARESITKAAMPLEIPPGQISAVQVKVKEKSSIDEIASRIMTAVPGTYAFPSLELTRTIQRQTEGLFRMLFWGLGVIWVLVVILSSFVFSLMVNERRREIGLLRAIGASRSFIFRLFLAESGALGLGGGIAGTVFAIIFVYLFKTWIMLSAEVPLLIPSLASLLGFMLACLLAALVLALPALLYPAVRASGIDPAVAMREV